MTQWKEGNKTETAFGRIVRIFVHFGELVFEIEWLTCIGPCKKLNLMKVREGKPEGWSRYELASQCIAVNVVFAGEGAEKYAIECKVHSHG